MWHADGALTGSHCGWLGLSPRAHAELPRNVVGRCAPRADPARMDAMQMVRRADRDAVVAAVVAAPRVKEDAMIAVAAAGLTPTSSAITRQGWRPTAPGTMLA